MNISEIRFALKNKLQVPFYCFYNRNEKQYFVRVFDAIVDKDYYRNIIYTLENQLFPNREASFCVFVYDIDETKEYFPQYYDCSQQWKSFLLFDFKKAVQAINFFVRNIKSSHCLDELSVLKAIFFADRYHLLKYGKTVTGDVYYAMKHGPVASGCKDICKKSLHLPEEHLIYSEQFLRFLQPHTVCSIKNYDESIFTSSDKEALNISLKICSSRPLKSLPEYTHNFFNWEIDYLPFLPKNKDKRRSISPLEFFSITHDDYCSEIPKEIIKSNLLKIKSFL